MDGIVGAPTIRGQSNEYSTRGRSDSAAIEYPMLMPGRPARSHHGDMTLTELAPSELLALGTLLDHYTAARGDGDAARWRSLVDDEVARRFTAVEDAKRMMDEARAARGG
jgi:hypothetical protein